jgi:deoxyribonuclease V
MNFTEYFYSLVSQIPKGRVSTYGALARTLGDIKAARAVGHMLNANPYAPIVPCHRVVKSNGDLGGFGGGIKKKIELLKSEKVTVSKGKIVDFEDALFTDFRSEYPLKKMRKEQLDLVKKVRIKDYFPEIKVVGGVDVAYKGDKGYGAYVAYEYNKKKIIDHQTTEWMVDVPYIPTYLAFREYPVIERLLKKVEQKPDILMVDGNGVMHPHNAGIATYVGVKLDIPTIGIAKSQLCGEVKGHVLKKGDYSKISLGGHLIGYALKSSSRGTKSIYISPGHKISFKTSLMVTQKYCRYKIPEPIRQAHNLANKSKDNSNSK